MRLSEFLTEKAVQSTWIASITHNRPNKVLTVILSNGRAFSIQNVTRSTFEKWSRAPSKGRYYHDFIKDKYKLTRMNESDICMDTVHETMRGGNLDKESEAYANTNSSIWKSSEHIADIEDFQVRQHNNIYSVWDGDILVGTTSLSSDVIPIVDSVWVNPEYRSKDIFSKLIWFYKTRLGHSKILLGDFHSKTMQAVVTHGLSRFHKSWYKDGVTEPFDVATIDNFYSGFKKTGWRLMLENDGVFENWPMFREYKNFITESYSLAIE